MSSKLHKLMMRPLVLFLFFFAISVAIRYGAKGEESSWGDLFGGLAVIFLVRYVRTNFMGQPGDWWEKGIKILKFVGYFVGVFFLLNILIPLLGELMREKGIGNIVRDCVGILVELVTVIGDVIVACWKFGETRDTKVFLGLEKKIPQILVSIFFWWGVIRCLCEKFGEKVVKEAEE